MVASNAYRAITAAHFHLHRLDVLGFGEPLYLLLPALGLHEERGVAVEALNRIVLEAAEEGVVRREEGSVPAGNVHGQVDEVHEPSHGLRPEDFGLTPRCFTAVTELALEDGSLYEVGCLG